MAAKRSDGASEKRGLRYEMTKAAGAAAVGGLVGLLLGALSPVGDWAEDRVEGIMGTDKVAVVGTLHRDGAILPNAEVILRRNQDDETFSSTTNNSGQYQFSETREGNLYQMDVSQNGVTILLGYLVIVPEDVNPYNVDVIDTARVQVVQQEQVTNDAPGEIVNRAFQDDRALAVQDPSDLAFYRGDEGLSDEPGLPLFPISTPGVSPGPSATPASGDQPEDIRLEYDASEVEIRDGTRAWTVDVVIRAGELESEITSVTYYLDPSFQPSVVTRTDGPEYRLQFETTAGFELAAIVTFSDGTMLELTEFLDLGP